MGAIEFALPDVGEGLTEATIVAWLVDEGQVVDVDTPLVEIETAKANVELPSPFAGTIRQLHCAVGETHPVGTALLTIDTTDNQAAPPRQPAPDPESEPAPEPEPKLLVGYGAPPARPAKRKSGVRAAPPVRALARELHVDLTQVPATGTHGEITRQDVLAHHDQPNRAHAIAVHGLRKHMAKAMVRSATESPQATMFSTIDATELLTMQSEIQDRPEFAHLKVTPFALIARCFVKALTNTPLANASLNEAQTEITLHQHINLGVAVATEAGLVVPNIKAAETLDFKTFIEHLTDVIDLARTGHLEPRQVTGGTVTMTNVGALGIEQGVPLLNPGEAVIMSVGALMKRPWVVSDEMQIRTVVQIALTFDHRILDGSEAAALLNATTALIDQPGLALVY
jgi:2-oxoisovalerate dehydrogenase E2 component (dihydrolipoyl transacylase)